MTQNQLSMIFEYIHNESALSALRSCGMPFQVEIDKRGELHVKLRTTIEAEKLPSISNKSKDSPVPHDGANKFSPLMIDMLMFAAHSGHEFSKFPGLNYQAQQEAYNWFVINGYFKMVDLMPSVALTVKGSLLVNKILNTTVD